jgi:hypothetical protein
MHFLTVFNKNYFINYRTGTGMSEEIKFPPRNKRNGENARGAGAEILDKSEYVG